MAITAKKRPEAPAHNAALDGLLPRAYEPITNDSVQPSEKGIGAKFRWVRAEGKQDKRDYWWRKGLRPVKGDLCALVSNAENYSKDTSGVIRRGSMQLWIEHPDNNAARLRETEAAAASQMKIIEAAQQVKRAARQDTGGGVQLEAERFGGVQIQQKVAPPPSEDRSQQNGALPSAVPDLLSE